MKLCLVALLVGVFTLAVAIPQTSTIYDAVSGKTTIVDKVFLEYNKNILRLLMHVHQPNTYMDQVQIAKTFDIESDLSTWFTNPTAVKEFVKLYRVGLLPRKAIFSVLDEVQRRQVIALFHMFYYARDFDTFYKCACWARDYVNEGMFVYALTVAVLHRKDCQGMILPAPYEIYPHYFLNYNVIKQAQQYKMQNFAMFKPEVMKRLLHDEMFMNKYQTAMGKTGYMKMMTMGEHWDENKHYMPGQMDMMKTDYMRKMGDVLGSGEKTMTSAEMFAYMKNTGKPYSTVSHMDYLAHGASGKTVGDLKVVIIPYNYTGWYMNVDYDQKLSYFMEDIGLNSYYYYFHMDYPFWMDGMQFGLNKDRRGELYYYFHQQLLARYYLERLSNGLGKIDFVDIYKPVKTQYVCSLHYENGLPFPMRPKNTDLIYDDYTLWTAKKMATFEKRIMDAIDSGFVITETGEKIKLYTENGLNVLGNLIQGNKDSVNRRFYGYLHICAKMLLGFSGKPVNHYQIRPSVLELYSTAMRDPMFYKLYKKIVYYFMYYKKKLPSYTYHDLVMPGVKVEDIATDKLITYFDYFDIELNNAIYTDFTQQVEPTVLVKARQMRLNHVPFATRINVMSDKMAKVVVRLFLGPKYDEFGHILNINDNRMNFVEIDKFTYELKVGKNVIEHNSRQARYTVQDRTSYYMLYKKMMLAIQGTETFTLDNSEAHCGFPNRLLLPKGKKGGMMYQFFVMITPYQGMMEDQMMLMNEEKRFTCCVGFGSRYIDHLPLGYPFDRKIDPTQFFVPNMYFKDVVIYHKRPEDVLSTKHMDTMMNTMTMRGF